MHRKGRKRWNGGGHKAFWSVGVEHVDRVHPTQKPLALMLQIISQFTDPGETVFDPFCGSGTTGVAALRLGRRFIGVEFDLEMAAVARERLQAEEAGLSLAAWRAGQTSMFGG
nr:site-specific DNA-methyltransferase [Nannocystis sp. ILAH1]